MQTLVAIFSLMALGSGKDPQLDLEHLANRDRPSININGHVIDLEAIAGQQEQTSTVIESPEGTQVEVSKDRSNRVTSVRLEMGESYAASLSSALTQSLGPADPMSRSWTLSDRTGAKWTWEVWTIQTRTGNNHAFATIKRVDPTLSSKAEAPASEALYTWEDLEFPVELPALASPDRPRITVNGWVFDLDRDVKSIATFAHVPLDPNGKTSVPSAGGTELDVTAVAGRVTAVDLKIPASEAADLVPALEAKLGPATGSCATGRCSWHKGDGTRLTWSWDLQLVASRDALSESRQLLSLHH